MRYQIPRGTFDILPEKSYLWQKMADVFRQTAGSFGYEEIGTPVFEMVELFERSSGENSDIVQKEMYRFQDKKGRWLALRPEGTAPVVRSYVENHLQVQGRITKLYYHGPMFRYDRPQAGRYRQFYQYGMELIGSHHPYYDAEIIAMQQQFLSKLGLRNIELELNSVGCPECSKVYDGALARYFRQYRGDLCADCQIRLESNPRRILDCKVVACREISVNSPSTLDYLDADCKTHFHQMQYYLQLMRIHYKINPRIVRGLDYYTHTAFEFLNPALGAQNAIGGGGRYDGLVEQIGGKSVPAVGFAGGFERLLLSVEKEQILLAERPKPDVWLILMGENVIPEGMILLQSLRSEGLSTEYQPEKDSLKAQLRNADAAGARFALILGDTELDRSVVLLKNLQDGSQKEYPLANLQPLLNSIRKNSS